MTSANKRRCIDCGWPLLSTRCQAAHDVHAPDPARCLHCGGLGRGHFPDSQGYEAGDRVPCPECGGTGCKPMHPIDTGVNCGQVGIPEPNSPQAPTTSHYPSHFGPTSPTEPHDQKAGT